MEKKDEIKQRLNELTSKALCLNEDELVFKSITEIIKPKDSVVGVIDQGWNEKKPNGIAITEAGIEWSASMLVGNVTINGKKASKPGNITFKELAHYKCSRNDKVLSKDVILTRTDLGNPNLLEIGFQFSGSDDIEQIYNIFESLVQIETVTESIPDEKRVDYFEAFIVEDNVNPIMRVLRKFILTTDMFIYKQAFAKYAAKGSWAFFGKGNFSTVIGWAFALLYRKIYVLGIVFLAMDFIVFSAIKEPWDFPAMALLMVIQSLINPFIIYKRYTGILKECSSIKMSRQQTIETLKKKGGSNGYLAVVGGILIIISMIHYVISLFS